MGNERKKQETERQHHSILKQNEIVKTIQAICVNHFFICFASTWSTSELHLFYAAGNQKSNKERQVKKNGNWWITETHTKQYRKKYGFIKSKNEKNEVARKKKYKI